MCAAHLLDLRVDALPRRNLLHERRHLGLHQHAALRRRVGRRRRLLTCPDPLRRLPPCAPLVNTVSASTSLRVGANQPPPEPATPGADSRQAVAVPRTRDSNKTQLCATAAGPGNLPPGPTQHKPSGRASCQPPASDPASNTQPKTPTDRPPLAGGGDLCGASLGSGRRRCPRTGAHHRRLAPSRRCHFLLALKLNRPLSSEKWLQGIPRRARPQTPK